MTQADTAEFSEFYAVNFPRIVAQIHAYLGDHAEAQDVTQEAFVRALDRWAKVSTYEHAQAWVRQVAWNLATSRLRRLQVARRYLARQRVELVDEPSPDRVALVEALALLPPKQRLAVVLHHLGQLSAVEIAQQEGVPEGTVRSWLSRGRTRLAQHLQEVPSLDVRGIPTPGAQAAEVAVRRRRTVRRATLAAVLALLLIIPIALLSRIKGGEPPIIGPTDPPVIITPSPSPTVRKVNVPGMTGQGDRHIQAVDGEHVWLLQNHTLVSTSDGGQTWQRAALPEITGNASMSMQVLDADTVTLGVIEESPRALREWLLTRDGGRTWTRHPPSSQPLESELAGGLYQLLCPGSAGRQPVHFSPCQQRELVKVGVGPVATQPPWRGLGTNVINGADGRLWLVQDLPSLRVAVSADGAHTWRELPKAPDGAGGFEVSWDGKRVSVSTDMGSTMWELVSDQWTPTKAPAGITPAASIDHGVWLVWQDPSGAARSPGVHTSPPEHWVAILDGGTVIPVPRYSTATDKKAVEILSDGTVMVRDSLGYLMGYGVRQNRSWVRVEF